MALTEVEQRLLDGFTWIANVTHEADHRGLVLSDGSKGGPPTFKSCTYKTCRYAAQIVAWAEAYDTMPRNDAR